MVTTVVSNFTGFFALGTVFTIMIGVGVADGTGFLSALLRKVAASTPKGLVTSVVVFLGIMSNIASSTGYVVLVPLGAILFMAFGRHPIAGLAAAFAGVSGGWSANLLIATNDPMFAGMSTQAAQTLDPNYTVLPVANWFFMIASTFLITAIGTLVTDKLVEPRLTPYVPDASEQVQDIAENEKRGTFHKNTPFLCVQVRHGIQHDKKCKQQCYHISISIHPVAAAVCGAIFLTHLSSCSFP